jgi:hypothetical protein
VRSSVNIHGLFSAVYPRTTWGPADDDDAKSCWTENTCDQVTERKSGRANLNSGICDDDAPIFGSAGGDAPTTDPGPHCWWYRDMLVLFDPITGSITDAFWIGDWQRQCDEMLISSATESRGSGTVPVVLRARGPLGSTGRPALLIAEAGDTVSISVDTTVATAADLDAALTRAGSMWKLKDASRKDGTITTTIPSTNRAESLNPESRAAELLRAVKRAASHHSPNRGRARELTTTVERRP